MRFAIPSPLISNNVPGRLLAVVKGNWFAALRCVWQVINVPAWGRAFERRIYHGLDIAFVLSGSVFIVGLALIVTNA